MAIRLPIALLALASTILAKPTHGSRHTARQDYAGSQGIQWGECDFDSTVTPIECGSLAVPLDYTDPDGGTLDLSLSKVSAVNEPFKGSILFNFGGPGYEAVETLGLVANLLLNMTGGQHDLIAFDPRGTGKTIPFSCYETPEERELATYKFPLITLSDATDVALGDLWANGGVFAGICGEARKDIGELIGTAFVARDIMQIVDALDEDGLLRFWGISYGSVLGATVAAMFPDRMDRVILDGVVNSAAYFNGYSLDMDQFVGADAAWRALLGECITAGEKCGLSQVSDTALGLETILREVAEGFRTDPVAVGDNVLDYTVVTTLYYIIVKNPNGLTEATTLLNNLITRNNLTAVADYFFGLYSSLGTGNEAMYGIKCADTSARASDRGEVMPEVEYLLQSSEEFGSILPGNGLVCAQWPFEAKERYTGDFRVETPNPILFIGNTYDAATPVFSAYGMSELFGGSVVVEQKGFGHGSIAQPSACTSKAIRDYFVDGVTPEGNIECEVDTALFI